MDMRIDRRQVMETAITAVTVVAGLIFSVAIGIAVEEVIFGEIFRLFFAEPAIARVRSWTSASVKGERTCFS
jgi:hypothetical protein